VLATVTGSDVDGDQLTWTLDFGDGNALAKGSLPHNPVGHTYDKAGTYLVRLAVSDGRLTTVKTTTIVVGLAEALAAHAGDDQVAVVNTSVHFDGSASRPMAGIESYHWTFGDGDSASGATVDHTYTTAGTYTAKLTVTAAGQSQQDSLVVTVKPAPTKSGLVVTVKDTGTNPVPGAELVVIDGAGVKYTAETDALGVGHLHGLPDGAYTIYGWKDGYLPSKTTGTVTNDAGTASLTLKQGQVAAASLTSTPLTYDQILAAGIDPNDPDNQHVFQFTVNLAFGSSSTTVSGYTATGGFPLCPTVDGVKATCDSSGASFSTDSYTISVAISYAHGQPQLVWLVIPGKASWLKEFFSVQMMVTNLSDNSFVLDHGSATLPLPPELSLAPTAVSQHETVTMPDLPGGQSATATWIVRGDTEGYYDLTSSYAGSLEPFGDTITVNAASQKPLHVWGASAIETTIDANQDIYDRYPYHVRVGLKNVADVPIYNASVELLSQGKQHYLYQPREALQQGTAKIDPGTTFWTDDYILASDISGTLDLGASFVEMASGTDGPKARIVSHLPDQTPSTAPTSSAVGLKDQVGLLWNSVPGATGYEIYSTPDRSTDFPPIPVQTLPAGTTSTTVTVPQGSQPWFAVSSIVNGKRTLLHPIADGTPSTQVTQPVTSAKLSRTASCGADVGVSAQFADPFFDLTAWSATLDDTRPAGQGSLSGRRATATFTVKASDIKPDGSRLRITATDSSGATGPEWSGWVSKDCDAIRMLVVGDSIAWGQGLRDQDKYPKLVADWLHEKAGRSVEYDLVDRNLAHSGAQVDPSVGCLPDHRAIFSWYSAGEIPSDTPNIGACQVTAAKAIPADLILVDGCINDIGVLNIMFSPLGDFTKSVPTDCGRRVTDMLVKLHDDHPNAKIVYTGYYPIIDQSLSPSQILKIARNYGLSQAALAGLTAELLKRNSTNFYDAYRAQAPNSVNLAVTARPGTWLEYADPGFVTGDGLFDSNSKLYDGVNDPMRVERLLNCLDADSTPGLGSTDRGKCLIASMGHPNEAGAKLYADAIESSLSHWVAGLRNPPTVKSLAVSPTSLMLPAGSSQKVTVTATYSDGSTGNASSLVTLTSDKPAVATVDNPTLTVKAIGAGTAQITATLTSDTNIRASVTVGVEDLAVTPTSPLLAVGKNLQLTATARLPNGTTPPVTSTATWTSSKTTVATVSSKGVVRGVGVGTATITAVYKDSTTGLTVSGSTTVTVLSGPPQITAFTPTSGPVGTQVTIQGADLLGATSVTFNRVKSTQFTVNSSSGITATVPPGAQTGFIEVTSPLGTAKSKSKFTVR